MNFRITPSVRTLEPLMVFGLVWTPVSMIVLPLFEIYMPLPISTRRIVLLVTVFVAALAGSAYSVTLVRRQGATMSWVDRGFYYFFWPLLFFAIFGFGVCLSKE